MEGTGKSREEASEDRGGPGKEAQGPGKNSDGTCKNMKGIEDKRGRTGEEAAITGRTRQEPGEE